ncbi:urea transporter [Kaistia dalseonensis]|uniref:Urea transporter n=1 Tax=Kaistia dalseonensis TaxID=410840 RepID=A0ABU0H111_9HYPH|nr:urea transporter [Kaistia dalseonensis]MCX5493438.1 urea transporter [Kaistia dalseonensis]MDQ0435997.1 urea transporter [Kaistia dalseonensis]
MNTVLAGWERLCEGSAVARFIDINLRGIGQVMFQDNPLTGALFLLAVAWGSIAGGVPAVVIGGVVAVMVATLTAQWLHVDPKALRAGLYGYNGVLVGLALPTFLAPGPMLWVYVVLGAAVSVVAMLAIANAVKPWGVSALTFPFVLITWLLLLASYGFGAIEGTGLPQGGVVGVAVPIESNPLHLIDFLGSALHSISQVFLKGSAVTAILLVAGLAVSSIPAALFAVLGALIAVVFAHLFGAESDLITGGLLGFSPVLTAIALGSVFYSPSPRVVAYAVLGTIFTVVVQAALNTALIPFAIPTLTAPFVIASWLFLLPRQYFEPTGSSDGAA